MPQSCGVSDLLGTSNYSSLPTIFPAHIYHPRPTSSDIPTSSQSLTQPTVDLLATLKQGFLSPMLPGYGRGPLTYLPLSCTTTSSPGCPNPPPSLFQPVSSTSVSRLRASSCHPLGRPHVTSSLVAEDQMIRWRTASVTSDLDERNDRPLDLTLRPGIQVPQSETVLNSVLLTPSESTVLTPSSLRKRSRTCVETRSHKADYSIKAHDYAISDQDNSPPVNPPRDSEEGKPVVVKNTSVTEIPVKNKSIDPTPQRRARRRCTSVRQKSLRPVNQTTLQVKNTTSLPKVASKTSMSDDFKEYRSDSTPLRSNSPGEDALVHCHTSSSDESSGPAVPHPGDERTQSLLLTTDEHNSSNSSSVGNAVERKTSRRSLSAQPSSCDSSRPFGQADPGICNPRMRRYPEMTPSDVKDDAYWQKRVKNNEAARRSRRARKTKEAGLREYASQLEKTNAQLTEEIRLLKKELDQLKSTQV